MPCSVYQCCRRRFLKDSRWYDYNVIYRPVGMGAVCWAGYESITKAVATLLWEIDELVMKLCSLCLFMPAWMCVWLSDRVWETGRGQNDSGPQTGRMKERPCLSSVDGGHRRTSQLMIFANKHGGFSTPPVAHEYQKNRSVDLHACGHHEYGYDDQSSDVLWRLVLWPRFYNDPMRNAD